MKDTKTTFGGVSVISLLGVAFVVLRLCGVITWPWIWVVSPFWIPFAIFVIVLIIGVIVKIVQETRKESRKGRWY